MANANGTQEPARGEDEVDQGFVALAEEIDNRHDVFFSDKESQVLDCYQQLEELCLERAILEAHTTKRHGQYQSPTKPRILIVYHRGLSGFI